MFTVCPKCALTLVVTAEDLRVAQGYVRCGRCSSVFNALARLTEERVPPEATAAPTPARPHPEPSAAERPQLAPSGLDDEAIAEDPIPEDALEFDPSRTDVSQVFVEPPPSAKWTEATGTFKAMLAANEAAQAEEEVPTAPLAEPEHAEGDVDVELGPDLLASILTAEPTAPAPQPTPPPPAAASPPPAPAAAPRPRQPPAAVPAPPAAPPPAPAPAAAAAPPSPRRSTPAPAAAVVPAAELEPASASRAAQPPGPESFERPASFLKRQRAAAADEEQSWAARLGWRAASVVLALILTAQIANHYRDDLAANAHLNRPLTSLYAALGVHLMPRWDLRAYDVRQLGASVATAGAGLITVRASIKNSAPQPQPLPLLRVTLQDRFGNRIAARDVAPPSYLPHPEATKLLSAGERIDAQMDFVDPGANAVGFEIDACLPTLGGEVTCANDVAAR